MFNQKISNKIKHMKNEEKKPLARLMGFIIKYSTIVIILIAAITVFFGYQMTKIKLDTDIYAFMTSAEPSVFVQSPDDKPTSKLKLSGIKETAPSPDKGEVVEIPYRDKSGLSDASDLSSLKSNYKEKVVDFEENPYWVDLNKKGYNDGYVIVFTSDEMFTTDVLNTIYTVRANLKERWEIGPCLSPFDYVTVEKHGTRLSIVPISPVKDGEIWADEDVEIFKTRLLNDSVAKNYLYTEDGSTIMLYYTARGINETSLNELDSIVNPLRQYGRVALNGGGMINNAVMKYINRDLIVLIALCFAVILIVYYLSFRSLRAMLIPASMSMMGIIWTLGTMALSGYDLTIVTILTPCLVLTLGSSYSIHMVSEYYETMKSGNKKDLPVHFAKISKTIFFAMLTTVLGFLSFLICKTKIFKDFGITIAIGVAFCGLLAFTYLPAVLSKTNPPKEKSIKKLKEGKLTKFVNFIAVKVVKYWVIFLIIVVVIFGIFMLVKDKASFDSNYMAYFPSSDPIVTDSLHFARTLGGTDPYYFTIRAPEGSTKFFLKSENLKDIYAFECAVLAACPDAVKILSFSQYVSFLNEVYNGESGIPENNGLINLLSRTLTQIGNNIGTDVLDMLISADGNEITLSIRNYDSVNGDLQSTSSAKRLEKTLDYYRYMLPSGTESKIWCIASDGVKSVDIIMRDQSASTLLSFALIFIVATIAFLSPIYGLMALVPVGVGVMINYIFMWMFGIPFDIVTIGFSSIAIGAGVDDAIHFVLRYRMKRRENPEIPVKELIKIIIYDTGRPIILTTLSIDAGLIMLVFASFRPIKYFGIMMCVALTAAMLATLLTLPPVIILCDTIKQAITKKRK